MMKKILVFILAGFMTIFSVACLADVNVVERVDDRWNARKVDRLADGNIASETFSTHTDDNRAYLYKENDGVFVFYETEDEVLYRDLLPEVFDMPDTLMVHLFVMDFYDIDSDADPYKEMSISLLGKHNGEDIWHCIHMPVTSEQSMIAGQVGLGLPKSIGEISFTRDDHEYQANIHDDSGRSASITLEKKGRGMLVSEEESIRTFMAIPKVNILKGELIEMTRNGGSINIIDVANKYPNLVKLEVCDASISFDITEATTSHPYDLAVKEVIAAYYMHNKIPFSLDRKQH